MNKDPSEFPSESAIHPVILVVDDEAALRDITKAGLEASGFQVLLAQDGVEALQQFEAHRNDIGAILMDVVMPNLNGIDAARKIREMDPSAKIILSTGFADCALAEANPDAILPKPYGLSTLRSLVKQVLLGDIFEAQSPTRAC